MTAVVALLSSVSSTAQAPAPASKVVYIHAGTLLDRPRCRATRQLDADRARWKDRSDP